MDSARNAETALSCRGAWTRQEEERGVPISREVVKEEEEEEEEEECACGKAMESRTHIAGECEKSLLSMFSL